MPYTPFNADWQDSPSAATPITAAALEYIEAGIVAAMAAAEGAIAKALADAKGDIFAASAADTVARLPVGANDTLLIADSAQTTGLKWEKIGNAMIATNAAIAISKLAGFPNDVTKALLGDGSWGTLAGAPVAAIMEYAGATAPTGWLLCDGAAVSRTTYAALDAILSTAGYPYGNGDGSTTFNLPDLRGRVPVGKGTHADVDTLGESDGAALADRRPRHKHTVNQTPHSHAIQLQNGSGTTRVKSDGEANPVSPTSTDSANANITIGPQSNSPTDAPAYITLNYIIKH